MKRKLWLLNFVLIAAIAAGVWRVRKDARQFDARKQATLSAKIPVPAAPPAPAAVAPPAVSATSYLEIAQKMLWSKDRNSQVIVEPPKPVEEKPLPPLPSVHGVINMGDGPIVMMSEKQSERQRGIHPGESIGPFKLVSVNSEELVLAFEDRTVKKKLQELIEHRDDSAAPAGGARAGASNAGSAPPAATPVAKPEPGVAIREGLNSCQPGDTAPAGTVANGMRKVVSATPFGMACRWEAVK